MSQRPPSFHLLVTIQDTQTGESRVFRAPWWDEWSRRGFVFMWVEGNYSCDCNRAIFFAEAAGEDGPDETPCGDGRYLVLGVTFEDGTIVPAPEGGWNYWNQEVAP